jgi:eukaryotic-like serine/threonine-protein kinase
MPRILPARIYAALHRDAATPLELPDEIARESRRRIRVAAVLGAGAYAVFLALEWTGVPGGSALERAIDLAHDSVGLGLCLVLLAATVARALSDRQVIVLALAVQVLISALISIAVTWASYVRTGHLSALTWVVPLIIFYPLLVPASRTLTLAVSSACALSMAAGPWLLAARGAIVTRPADALASLVTGAVAVAIATVASQALYGARRQIEAARTIGSYELIERIAAGGMGEVWKAQHLLLARPAAIKLILPAALQGADERRAVMMERFTREAQVTAGLRSPHTVQLFDFGAAADGTLYYVMELLEGMNLEHFVYRYGAIEPRRAVDWLRQACHSLAEAHARGLVHRDIKPANLFVGPYGRDLDFVKVLDFGLTRHEPAAGATPAGAAERSVSLTATGTTMGTPSTMAPEQWMGRPADPRTDLYALGCVGYWLLAGAKPFEAETLGEMMRLHLETPPPPLARTAKQEVPSRLEAVILSCMAKDPGARPPDADALGARLEAALDGDSWSASRARAWWDANGTSRDLTLSISAPTVRPEGRDEG